MSLFFIQSNNTQQVEAASSDNYKTVYENLDGKAGLYRNPFVRLNQNSVLKVVKARHFRISMRVVADNGMVWFGIEPIQICGFHQTLLIVLKQLLVVNLRRILLTESILIRLLLVILLTS